jgi:hypothetical protein
MRKKWIYAALLSLGMALPALATAYTTISSVVNLPVTGGATLNSNIACLGVATGEQRAMVTQITVKSGESTTTFGVVPSDTGLTGAELFNSGTALTAGAKYTFTWLAKPGVTYDWYYGTTTVIQSQDTVQEGR